MTTKVSIQANDHKIGVILYDGVVDDPYQDKIVQTIIMDENTSLDVHVWKGRSIKIYEIE